MRILKMKKSKKLKKSTNTATITRRREFSIEALDAVVFVDCLTVDAICVKCDEPPPLLPSSLRGT